MGPKLIIALLGGLSWSPIAWGANLSQMRPAVVKIQSTPSLASYTQPWNRYPSSVRSGTGFYIGNGRILTNAHVAADASYLTVQRDRDAKPTPAYVRFIAHESDLALLEVTDPQLFDGVTPLVLGGVPKLRSPVSTIGFPLGGEQLSVTDGIVSRIGYQSYVHDGHAEHLLVQVDAAINPGNSGGPVVQGSHVIGVAFQSMVHAQNTGYIIPSPVIEHFLRDIADGRYDGHPQSGLEVMEWAMLNPATAAYHGLSPEAGGVKVSHVASWAPTAGLILPGDILLQVDGQKIGVDARIVDQGERVDFRHLIDIKQMGEDVTFHLIRGGLAKTVSVPLRKTAPHPSMSKVYARHPKYLVYGGLVFMTLSRSLLESWGDKWYREAPLLLRYLNAIGTRDPTLQGLEDVIVLIKRLPHEVNAFATGNMLGVVTQVNGEPVRSLEDLAAKLKGGSSDDAIISFLEGHDPLILARDQVTAAEPRILKDYGVDPAAWFFGAEVDGAITRESLK